MPTQATADQRQKIIDPTKKWLNIVIQSGQVKSVSCLLSVKHHDKLQCVYVIILDGTEGLMKQWHKSNEFEPLNFKAQPPREIWMKIHARVINLQCQLTRAKSHTLQERKIRHIHCGVRTTVGVHSATILLSSINIDLSGPAFTK